MNNPHIISTTSTAFGLNFSKEHNYNFGQQNYGEIDERLFDTYLEISGRKNNDLFDEPTKSLSTSSSADVSSADESDSSSYHKSTMGRSHKSNNSTRKTKCRLLFWDMANKKGKKIIFGGIRAVTRNFKNQ
jgi:hypothetical protein